MFLNNARQVLYDSSALNNPTPIYTYLWVDTHHRVRVRSFV
jgi:hypothetical protein